uniref:histidine kinase n=1 Tax=Phenylobacterium glaciei TaxID=2803784 RepID=A0A974S7M4_9CAUL|nr:hypothetical protein JKL49_26320 [Phenylobacterium glaciei]
MTAARFAGEGPVRCVVITQSIQDLKESESQLRELNVTLERARDDANAANDAKSAFLATMSHEIRTPLNGVLGMAQAMARDELPDIQRERLTVIRQAGETLLALLNDLLDLSRIEAGRLELEDSTLDVEQLVQGRTPPSPRSPPKRTSVSPSPSPPRRAASGPAIRPGCARSSTTSSPTP